jgi:hypothetical protein
MGQQNMQTLVFDTGCDRGMDYPPAGLYVADADECIAVLRDSRWASLEFRSVADADLEMVAVFLRDHSDCCPAIIRIVGRSNPLITVKVGIWLSDKTTLYVWG